MEKILLHVDSVIFTYDKKKKVLHNCGFSVKEREIISVIGPNGAGKTTLFNLIFGLLHLQEGSITLFDQPIRKVLEAGNTNSIGYLPQEESLFENLTVYENLELVSFFYGISKDQVRPKIEKLMSVLSLEQYQYTLFKNLSGGYKKLACLAAAILHKPKLLLLDEPFENLDIQHQDRVVKIIRFLNEKGTTILISSHILDPLKELCDEYLILKEGKIAQKYSKAEMKNMELYQTIRQEILEKEDFFITDW